MTGGGNSLIRKMSFSALRGIRCASEHTALCVSAIAISSLKSDYPWLTPHGQVNGTFCPSLIFGQFHKDKMIEAMCVG